jgi:hypothetical protein
MTCRCGRYELREGYPNRLITVGERHRVEKCELYEQDTSRIYLLPPLPPTAFDVAACEAMAHDPIFHARSMPA